MKINDLKNMNDDELIGNIQSKGHSLYFEELYLRYHQKVLHKCYGLVKNHQLAEELTEDILSKTFEKLPGFEFRSSFSSWLYSITYNHCIDFLRKKKKLHYPEWNRSNEIPEIVDESSEEINDINYENFIHILDIIHPEEKALILMKYQENFNLKQIASSLKISEDAVKMRLKRARTRIIYLYKLKFPSD